MTKEALKLALEALEFYYDMHKEEADAKAITAIKQALANDALEKKAENARELGLDYEPEPYKVISDHITQTTGGRAYVDPVTGNVSVGTVAQPSVSVEQEYHAVNAVHKGQQCYVKTQPKEPEQEPVGDFYITKDMAEHIKKLEVDWTICASGSKRPTEKKVVPVFVGNTTPPQRTWVGLTDIDYAGLPLEQVGLVRWAEAKLKEKNT